MWIVEAVSIPLIVCITLALFLMAAWTATGRSGYLFAGLSMPVLCLAILLIDGLVMTDSEQVQQSVYDLAESFEQGDQETLLNSISIQSPEIRTMAELALQYVKLEGNLRVTDLRIELKSGNSRASTHFRANGSIAFRGRSVGHQTSRWNLTWQKEGGEWKVIRVQQLHPQSGEPIAIPFMSQ